VEDTTRGAAYFQFEISPEAATFGVFTDYEEEQWFIK
jgi:hypothetical protein